MIHHAACEGSPAQLRVLSVSRIPEHHAAIRDTLRRMRGVDVVHVSARSGRDAARVLAEASVAVVIVDAELGDTRGLRFLAEARRKQPGGVRLLMIPGRHAFTLEHEFRDAGVHACLERPVKSQELTLLLFHALRGHGETLAALPLESLVPVPHTQLASAFA